MSDARRLIAWAKFNQRVTIGQWGALQDYSAQFVPGVMWQQLSLPKLKAARKGFFSAVLLRNFGPDRLKCRVQAHVGAKPIKNYERSCDRIECVFQKAELSVGCAGVGGFSADVFK